MSTSLSAYLYKDETACVMGLLRALPWDDRTAIRVQGNAEELIEQVRGAKKKSGDLEMFFQHYGLDTKEGLALMCMAEALLRIPDVETANALIRDKVAATNWLKSGASNKDWLAQAAGLGLSLTSSTINSLFSKLGEPIIRTAMMQAMKILGKQFVIGETISSALEQAAHKDNAAYRMSYDMLGEGARTAQDAERYFEAYVKAIESIGKTIKGGDPLNNPGISVKLSALHPRYCVEQEDFCVPALADKLLALSNLAADKGMPLTVDAEEVDRLELSLKIIQSVLNRLGDRDWTGFGLAVQAYQKRCLPLIDVVADMARAAGQKIQVRIVKGAYWDSEIKRAQVMGLEGYPVFTRKVNTDLSYLACAHKMLQHDPWISPLFATHNAHTIMAILDMAAGRDVEFQKLYGMGNALHAKVLQQGLARVSVYAPVGSYTDLLPYLVRRLLENGANSSFVKMIYDTDVAVSHLAKDPVRTVQQNDPKYHPSIPLPADLFGEKRRNSSGLDLRDAAAMQILQQGMKQAYHAGKYVAAPLIAGKMMKDSAAQDVINPSNLSQKVGTVYNADDRHIDAAFAAAKTGHQIWSQVSANRRAAHLRAFADSLEKNRAALMALIMAEAGKTYADARDEIREAVDFARYYAFLGETQFDEIGVLLYGPTGESNYLLQESRGIFVCISPWNFPLAIFTGQIAAALMAGNAVIAKPAEQTPLIAFETVQLMLKAGIPREAITLLPGDGRIGAALVQHDQVAGVAFTGSTEAAWSINRTLAAKDGPIVPLIAETGGMNALIADTSALPEQVVDSVIVSAFGSTGQRCSSARVFFVQDECADKILSILSGAMKELKVGNPADLSNDFGPVIDEQALQMLNRHKFSLDGFGKKIAQVPMHENLKTIGHFFAPVVYEISHLSELKREVFGPILHVIRYAKKDLDTVLESINASGYGLTLGVHSRIDATIEKIQRKVRVGNVYVNRSQIGAVVGVQPFGGRGLSGTGPKAGGPDYLQAFATEKVISRDITASGGNASLVMLEE